jgi:hypothetical protein
VAVVAASVVVLMLVVQVLMDLVAVVVVVQDTERHLLDLVQLDKAEMVVPLVQVKKVRVAAVVRVLLE